MDSLHTNAVNLQGRTVGHLKVLRSDGKTKDGHIAWLCECHCGKLKRISSQSLNRKHPVSSCGCLNGIIAAKKRVGLTPWNESKSYLIRKLKSVGGLHTIANAIVLCPNCHRIAHSTKCPSDTFPCSRESKPLPSHSAPLGWKCAAVAEVDPFCSAVLKYHYPNIPNLGDVTAVCESQITSLGHLDLVVFGSPCQDLSIAGKREGIKGARSGLFFDAMRIVRWSKARFALFENVPGLFSTNRGRDFAAVVGEMAGVCPDVPNDGWKNTGVFLGPLGLVEYSVLDAQWFGVPQRRRRVFALADFGDWRSRAPILFIRDSLSGNFAPSREQRQDVAPTISARTKGGGGLGTDFDCDGGLVASTGEISHCLNGGGYGPSGLRGGDPDNTLASRRWL